MWALLSLSANDDQMVQYSTAQSGHAQYIYSYEYLNLLPRWINRTWKLQPIRINSKGVLLIIKSDQHKAKAFIQIEIFYLLLTSHKHFISKINKHKMHNHMLWQLLMRIIIYVLSYFSSGFTPLMALLVRKSYKCYLWRSL